MKNPVTALAILLCISALCAQVFTTPIGVNTPSACCFSYARQIPQTYVVNYYETTSQCSKPGVIFITKKSREICANPGDAWVQEYITNLRRSA
ncbi:PREDICTED: c-C motif chemokine 3 [Elephantulus edwardii]|uniref:c-C motif chemokine 3 n=1 Tax=Elephantulus edwardii TaxID=28737 RepID=UPI0003F09D60|nr:PREDICTED: c-C motif chemokine 3 [Elephantulus edwardii]